MAVVPHRRRLRSVALLGLIALALPGCSKGDNASDPVAFCATATKGKAGGNPFAALQSRDAALIETAMRELEQLYDEMHRTAPPGVSPSVDALRDDVREVVDILERHDFDVIAAAADLKQSPVNDATELQRLGKAGDQIERYLRKRCPTAVTTGAKPTTTLGPAGE